MTLWHMKAAGKPDKYRMKVLLPFDWEIELIVNELFGMDI